QDLRRSLLLAGFVSTAISPSLGVTTLCLGGFTPWTEYGAVWLTWWLGDVGGALTVAPPLILWAARPRPGWSRRQAMELGAIFLLLFLIGELEFLVVTVVVAMRLAAGVAERRRAYETLRQQAADLARSNAELEQFAHVASHDLQEPLRTVTNFVQLLAKRYRGRLDPDADDFIRFTVDGTTRMARLIDDLLEFSRAGRADQPMQPTNCREILAKALSNLDVAIKESGAVVRHDGLPTVQGDPTQLTQLFQNLIGNAVKFRGADTPEVRLSAERRG